MSTEQLVRAIRDRALNEATRTDARERPEKLFDVVDPSVILGAETKLGFELPKLLATLYLEIGNGGFGPGFGIFGLRGGHTDARGHTLVEIYPEIQEGVAWSLKDSGRKFLPICEWGSGVLPKKYAESVRQAGEKAVAAHPIPHGIDYDRTAHGLVQVLNYLGASLLHL